MATKECNGCKEHNKVADIPYIVHESAMARMERQLKRLWITILVLIVLLVGTNAAWLYFESQFEDVYQEVVQEADNGTNNFVGGDIYGEADN